MYHVRVLIKKKPRRGLYLSVYIGQKNGLGLSRKDFLGKLSKESRLSISAYVVLALQKFFPKFPNSSER